MTEPKHAAPALKCTSHKHYGLTCDDYDRLVARAGGRCEICLTPAADTSHGKLHIDHDPFRGQHAVRGLLCSRCNTNLGRGLIDADIQERWLSAPLFKSPDSHPPLRGIQLGPVRQVRVPDEDWDRFAQAVGSRNRSTVITELIRWFNENPAELTA